MAAADDMRRIVRRATDPLFRQAGIDLDGEGNR